MKHPSNARTEKIFHSLMSYYRGLGFRGAQAPAIAWIHYWCDSNKTALFPVKVKCACLDCDQNTILWPHEALDWMEQHKYHTTATKKTSLIGNLS